MEKTNTIYKIDFCDSTSVDNYVSHDTIFETSNLSEAVQKFNSLPVLDNNEDFYELIKCVDGEHTEWNNSDIDVAKVKGNEHLKCEVFWLTRN